MKKASKKIREALSDPERDRLAACEGVIEGGLVHFFEVGKALLVIRDSRLYRQDYPTFEDYLARRWDLSRSRGYQLTEASEMSTIVGKAGLQAPTNEGQARELAPLKDQPEKLAEAWREAVETAPDGRVTAKHVRKVVRARAKQEAPEESAAKGVAVVTPSLQREEDRKAREILTALESAVKAVADVTYERTAEVYRDSPKRGRTVLELCEYLKAQGDERLTARYEKAMKRLTKAHGFVRESFLWEIKGQGVSSGLNEAWARDLQRMGKDVQPNGVPGVRVRPQVVKS
jgi:hypothetical protein